MKSKKNILILFIIVAIVQLLAPLKMIYNQEEILNEGKGYKFLTEPLDPNDPFRGKYVRLNYDINSLITNDTIWKRNEKIYIYLKDSLGFAKLETVSKVKLDNKNDYVVSKVNWFYKDSNKLTFNLPFNRFYMEESKAKPAEDLVRNNRGDTINNTTYALVYIKKGEFVLDNVFINDQPIADIVRKNLKK